MTRRARCWAGALVGLAISAASTASQSAGPRTSRGGRDRRRLGERPRTRLSADGSHAVARHARAEQSIAQGEFAQALTFLDDVLGRAEDFFTETGAEGGYAGLKEAARRLIRDLPPEGRRAYEATYGPVAERLLKSAVGAGDATALEAVAQRYFYTPAGYQAVLLLATDEADAGRHLSAALCCISNCSRRRRRCGCTILNSRCERRRAGLPRATQARRSACSKRWPAAANKKLRSPGASGGSTPAETRFSGCKRTVGEPADVVAAPEAQWLTYRGNASRNGATAGGLPHMRSRWRVELLYPYDRLEELFREYNEKLVESEQATPVANVPLAAGDYVLVRTPYGLLAVDFRTGKRIWRSELQRDAELEQLIKSGDGADEEAANAEAARSFARRIWEDYLYNTMSSDGDRVYVIRDLPMPSAQDYETSPIMGMGGTETAAPTNRLSAYELASEGTLVWEIDGAGASGELAGAFFLGAPLQRGLVAVRAGRDSRRHLSGRPRSRALASCSGGSSLRIWKAACMLDLRRRLQAAMPSYDSGMLVCPTGAGVVVGVDLAKRSLAWAYRYDAMAPLDGSYRGGPADPGSDGARQWTRLRDDHRRRARADDAAGIDGTSLPRLAHGAACVEAAARRDEAAGMRRRGSDPPRRQSIS